MIAHVSYIKKLNTLNDYSPEWPSVAAGLVVLRLVDAWLREGADVIRRDTVGLEEVRRAIGRLGSKDPIRPILSKIADVAEQSEVAIVQWVSPFLWRYGDILERQGKWECARDVFCSTRDHARAVGDPGLTMWSALRVGPLARQACDLNAADSTFAIATEAANQIGHNEGRLRARLGLTRNILMGSGNVSQAITALRDIEADARSHDLSNITAIALYSLGSVFLGRDCTKTIQCNMAASRLISDPKELDRGKGTIAAALACLGHLETARKFHLSLLTHAREEFMRQCALINLIELAAQRNDKVAFEGYYQDLAGAPLHPQNTVAFHVFAGQGLASFGKLTAAQGEFEHALTIATEHQLMHMLPTIHANLSTASQPTKTVMTMI